MAKQMGTSFLAILLALLFLHSTLVSANENVAVVGARRSTLGMCGSWDPRWEALCRLHCEEHGYVQKRGYCHYGARRCICT